MFTANNLSEFNELEIGIYNYIIQNKNSVSYMRIRELADETHVSTSSILRLCKKLGCDGFSEFKIKLKMELNKNDDFNIKNDTGVILEFFNRTQSDTFKKDLLNAVKLMKESHNLLCIGFGNSAAMARYGATYFAGMGKFALDISDPFYPTQKIYVKDIVSIIFSVSGDSSHIIEHANSIKRNGGKIISITNSKNCTLAKMSDCNLAYYVQQEKKGIYDLTTQVPVVYIIEAIAKMFVNE